MANQQENYNVIGNMVLSNYRQTLEIVTERDLELVTKSINEAAAIIRMRPFNKTRLNTAAIELARNMIKYANGGIVIVETLVMPVKGIRMVFQDKGPGIPNVEKAMTDGYTTGTSPGVGLPGSKRLVDGFKMNTQVGIGTTITIVKWTSV